jgi:hypothetical protein
MSGAQISSKPFKTDSGASSLSETSQLDSARRRVHLDADQLLVLVLDSLRFFIPVVPE